MKHLKLISLLSLLVLASSATNVVEAGNNNQTSPSQTYKNDTSNLESYTSKYLEDYIYNTNSTNLTKGLQEALVKAHRYYTSYEENKGGLAYADEDPNNDNNVICFYTLDSLSNTWNANTNWNREHVWPKSRSGGLYDSVSSSTRNAGTDIHHLRVTRTSVNSRRGNLKYGDVDHNNATNYTYNGVKTNNYIDSSTWEPRDEIKGDVARTIMYMYTHYSTDVNSNAATTKLGNMLITNVISESSKSSCFETLLNWSKIDPVDDFELNRNLYCASVTGVRNPFVDYPELGDMAFGNYPYKALMAPLTANEDNISLALNSTYQINLNKKEYATYTSNNDSIVAVDENGLLTSKKEGSAIITCRSGAEMIELNVVVGNSSSSGNNNNNNNNNSNDFNNNFVNSTIDSSLSFDYSLKTSNSTSYEDSLDYQNPNSNNFTSTTNATYSSNSHLPGLKFENNLQSVTYTLKGPAIKGINYTFKVLINGYNASNPSSVSLLGLDNNDEVLETKEITTLTSRASEVNGTLYNSNITKVKFVYNKKVGNLALGSLTYTYGETKGYDFISFSNFSLKYRFNFDFSAFKDEKVSYGALLVKNADVNYYNSLTSSSSLPTNGNVKNLPLTINQTQTNHIIEINNIPLTSFDETITCVFYYYLNNTYYFSNIKSESYLSMLNKYALVENYIIYTDTLKLRLKDLAEGLISYYYSNI